jgi:hypothetical protein
MLVIRTCQGAVPSIYREIDNFKRNVFRFAVSLAKRDCNSDVHEVTKLAPVDVLKKVGSCRGNCRLVAPVCHPRSISVFMVNPNADIPCEF